jgi:hypothetical protein
MKTADKALSGWAPLALRAGFAGDFVPASMADRHISPHSPPHYKRHVLAQQDMNWHKRRRQAIDSRCSIGTRRHRVARYFGGHPIRQRLSNPSDQ